MPRKQRTFLPQTQAAIDSLLARLLRTETLAVLGVGVIALVGDLQSEEMISSGAAGVALVLGRSLVKRGGK
jgi:small-conductance mechanosensitive channel